MILSGKVHPNWRRPIPRDPRGRSRHCPLILSQRRGEPEPVPPRHTERYADNATEIRAKSSHSLSTCRTCGTSLATDFALRRALRTPQPGPLGRLLARFVQRRQRRAEQEIATGSASPAVASRTRSSAGSTSASSTTAVSGAERPAGGQAWMSANDQSGLGRLLCDTALPPKRTSGRWAAMSASCHNRP